MSRGGKSTTIIEDVPSGWVSSLQSEHRLMDAFGLNVTKTKLRTGTLRGGSGNVEWYGDQYVVKSFSSPTGFIISRQLNEEFYAASTIQILGGEANTSWAGIMHDPSGRGKVADGSLFFGKDHSKVKILHAKDSKLTRVIQRDIPVKPRSRDFFELVKLAGRYRFFFNGDEVATLLSPVARRGVIEIVVGRHTIGAFASWSALTR